MTETGSSSDQSSGPRPNLQLGPPPAGLSQGGARQRGLGAGTVLVIVLLLLANLAIGITSLGRKGSDSADGDAARSASLNTGASAQGGSATSNGDEGLALELEERSLWKPAALEWLAAARQRDDSAERAKAYYKAGTLFEKARDHEQAAAAYVAADVLLGDDKTRPLKSKIGLRLTNCFRVLGRSGELGRELARRTQRGEGGDAGKAKVVAYVGDEPVTEADLDALIEAQVDRMMGYGGGMGDPKAREQALSRLREPAQRKAILQQLLEQQVLVRRARELGLDREEAFQSTLDQVERSLLSQALIRKQVGDRLAVTPGDVKNYYESHKARFKGPSTAKLLVMELKNKEDAEARRKELADKDEAAFRAAVKKHSVHAASKEKGGELDSPHTKGRGLLDLAYSAELDKAVFEGPDKQVSQVLEIDKRVFIVFVLSRTLDPQKSFEEVREQVRYAYLQEKQRELTQALIQDLQGRYKIRIVESGSAPAEKKTQDGAAPKAAPGKK